MKPIPAGWRCFMNSINFQNIDWSDSNIEKVIIEYNCATFEILNYAVNKTFFVKCTGFIGISNLCFFDDMIIFDTDVVHIDENSDEFVSWIYTEYGKDYKCYEWDLSQGILALKIKMVNNTELSVYCQKIEVLENN